MKRTSKRDDDGRAASDERVPQRRLEGEWMTRRTDIPLAARAVALYLLGRANRDGTFGRSRTKATGAEWLGQELGIPRATAGDYLRALVEAEPPVLELTGKVRVGRGWANVYRIVDPYLFDVLAQRATLTLPVDRQGGAATVPVGRHIGAVPVNPISGAFPVDRREGTIDKSGDSSNDASPSVKDSIRTRRVTRGGAPRAADADRDAPEPRAEGEPLDVLLTRLLWARVRGGFITRRECAELLNGYDAGRYTPAQVMRAASGDHQEGR
jgi:hypothetical protein